jgi:UDP-N-acetylmuramoyl-L-alanyl-D-glutamate--2,6-diaminopimelate ligase
VTPTLRDLLRDLPDATVTGDARRPVRGVAYDSRRVTPGAVFVAIAGFTVDGHRFVADARDRGAAAVVVERGRAARPAGWDGGACAWVEVADSRRALSALAAAWHGHPGERLHVIGVTGTDGKTTTSTMTCAVLDAAGATTGLISTVQFKIGERWEENDTRQTTPEAPEVQALLARMAGAGVTHAVVESTSHGLALRKLDHCCYDVAVVTNVTEDHLDFHGTRAAYLAAKGRLFELAGACTAKPGPRFAVLNADDDSLPYLRARTRLPVLTYGVERPADLRGAIVEALPAGSRVAVSGRWGNAKLWVPMAGPFNVANALAAIAVGLGHDVPLARACAALAAFPGVPGRMTAVDAGQPFTVIVDYAHTGHSFRKLLGVLRPLTRGRLIAVFGGAGERAPERRAGMGGVAAELADFAVLTTEDPRFEDPDRIIDDIARVMAAAGRREGRDFVRVADRREAIRTAFAAARPGDVVVLAGKGHEQSIIVGAEKVPWDDRRVAREELAGRAGAPPARGPVAKGGGQGDAPHPAPASL